MEDCFKVASTRIRGYYREKDPFILEDSVIDIAIGYDGSWHRRGFSSHYGIGVIIELNTGLVLDVHVMSNLCLICQKGPKTTDDNYDQWFNEHKSTCTRNHTGSASSMELEAARVLFSRSVNKYNIRYTQLLCDGDSKTVSALNNDEVYGSIPIVKSDCINHVNKRLYNEIEKLKQVSRNTSHHLTGRGRVTKKLQKQLSVRYTQALKDNTPCVSKMKNGVKVSLFHRMSSDDKPIHQYCPESWCKYNVQKYNGVAESDITYKHRCELKPVYGQQLIPLYERLSRPDLLERCKDLHTTNANESFNGQVWRRVPKYLPTSPQILETGVAMSVLEFNYGSRGIGHIFRNLGISTGYYFDQFISMSTKKRRLCSIRHSSHATKKRRIDKKLFAAGIADTQQQKEGTVYASGGFND